MEVAVIWITVVVLIGLTDRCLSQVNLKGSLTFTLNNKVLNNDDSMLDGHPVYGDHKLGDPIPNHLTSLECQGTMWVEECRAGNIHTFKNLNKEVCNLFCYNEDDCKSYIFHPTSGNCGLLSAAPGGTTKAIGISGPELSLHKPNKAKDAGGKPEDCSQFHFQDCSQRQLQQHNETVRGQNVSYAFNCGILCTGDLLHVDCQTLLYQDFFNKNGWCWNSAMRRPNVFLSEYCRLFFGQAEGSDPTKYETCINGRKSQDLECKKGYCDLPHYEKKPMVHAPEKQKSERRCKGHCGTYPGCSHYQWDSRTKECRFYNISQPIEPYICTAAAGKKGVDIGQCLRMDCQWSEWESWGSCSTTCRGEIPGKRTRRRKKKVEAYPPGIGTECIGLDVTTESCTDQTQCPGHKSGPGKILITSGIQGGYTDSVPYTDSVKILDPEMKTYCEMPNFPIKTAWASGSFFDNSGTLVPVVCGGNINNDKGNCYIYEKEHQKWMDKFYSFKAKATGLAMVSLGKGIFSAGGEFNDKLDDDIIIISTSGANANNPKLKQPMHGACAAVIKVEEGIKTIAVLGGHDGKDYMTEMEIFSCHSQEIIQCVKKPDGPNMQRSHHFFGCGVIQAQNGRQVLLAMKDYRSESATEILALDDDSAQWKILEKDPVRIESNLDTQFSLIISQDPTKGYFFPQMKDYLYEVTCKNAQDCSFLRRDGYDFLSNLHAFVAMSLPKDHGFQCD